METDDQPFLDSLPASAKSTFENRFTKILRRLDLGLDPTSARLLLDTAFAAALCNIALNGLGGGGEIKPSQEGQRRRLEIEFMRNRDALYATDGWRGLAEGQRDSIERVFLCVFVNAENLAGLWSA